MNNTKSVVATVVKNIVSETQMWTLERVNNISKSVDIDKHFQSPARWNHKQMRDYMHSLFSGIAPSKYVFVDLKSCLKESQDGNQTTDVEYYSKWFNKSPNSTLYLNLDSNNRFTTLQSLFTNQLALNPGTYYDSYLKEFKIKRNQKWSDFSSELKKFILSREITVEVYTKSTREQLSDIFLAVNRGTPLNDAEKRNSIISDISKVCRDLGEKYFKNELTSSSTLRKAFKNSDIKYNRREIDAWFTNCAFIKQNGVSRRSSPNLLEDSYQPGSDMDKNHTNIHNSISDFFENWVNPNSSLLEQRPSVNILLDLYVMNCNKPKITNVNKFVKEYWDVVKSLIDDRETQYSIGERSYTFNELLRARETIKTEKRNEILEHKLSEKKDESKNTIKIKSETGIRKLVRS